MHYPIPACATIPSSRTGAEWTPTNGTMSQTPDTLIAERSRREAERDRNAAVAVNGRASFT